MMTAFPRTETKMNLRTLLPALMLASPLALAAVALLVAQAPKGWKMRDAALVKCACLKT